MARQYESSGVWYRLRPIFIGLAMGMLVSALLFFLFSIWVTFQDTPQSLIEPLAVFSLSAGAFFAGFVCTRTTRRNGLVYGVLCGLVLSAIVLLVGMIVGVGGVGLAGVFRVVFAMLCSMIGGVLGVNVKRRR